MPDPKTKIFRLSVRTAPDAKPAEHLVRANNLMVAKEFITRDLVTGELASQEDILRLARAGAEVLDVNAPAGAAKANGTKK